MLDVGCNILKAVHRKSSEEVQNIKKVKKKNIVYFFKFF